tara:strand:- start:1248 stop:2411 length:1164 start_codon:yes stop_codon:yes gene_type:complete
MYKGKFILSNSAKIVYLFFLIVFVSCKNEQKLISGAEQTIMYIKKISNKNVGIVANQTSVIGQTHLVDSLTKLNINITKIFSPEHGFKGDKDAGKYIPNRYDATTGIPIISLYGKNKKPSKDDMQNIDVLVFDLQDVGVRFYTYLSTLHYVLEACAENDIQVLVLDRPNPNGHYIDGPILDTNFKSFVGLHPVPIVYAMTIGEYAKMINGERWINDVCDLEVIKMVNYNRDQLYELPIKPSPNLPNAKSINLYPSLCLFEGTNVSVGRGTDKPFQQFGSPYLNTYDYSFVPASGPGSKFPKHENKVCKGENLANYPYINHINLGWLISSFNQTENKEIFFNSFFDKLAGNDKLRNQIEIGLNEDKIKNSWKNELENFKKIRMKYLIY